MGAFAGVLEGIRSYQKDENDKAFALEQKKRDGLLALYKGIADSPDARPEIRQQAYSRLFQISTTPADKKLPKDIGDLSSLMAPPQSQGMPSQPQPLSPPQPQQLPQAPQPLPGIDPVGAAPLAPQQPAIPPQAALGMSGQAQANTQQGTLPNLSPVPGGENVVNPQTAAATGAVPGMFITPQEKMIQQATAAYNMTSAQKQASVDIDNAQRRLKLAELRSTPEFQGASSQQQAEMLFEAGFGGNLSRAATGIERQVGLKDRNGNRFIALFTPGIGYINASDRSPVDPLDINPDEKPVERGAEVAEVQAAMRAFQDKNKRPPTAQEEADIRHQINLRRRQPLLSPNATVAVVDNRDGSFKYVNPIEARGNPNLAPIRQSFDEAGTPTIGGAKGTSGSLSAPAPIPGEARDQIVGITGALNASKDARQAITRAQSILGPVWGRLSNLSFQQAGGLGLSPEQQEAINAMYTLFQSRAFADAGKALTGIERDIVESNLPKPTTDTFGQMIIKLNRLDNVLSRKRDNIQQLLTPQQRSMIGGGKSSPAAIPPVIIEFTRDANGKLVRK